MAARGPARKVKVPNDPKQYGVGIICALEHEAAAIQATFDCAFRPRDLKFQTPGDKNFYTFGTIGKFHVVLAHLGTTGVLESTIVATHMRRTFPNIQLCLVVGICAIIPSLPGDGPREELTLGDVVISTVVKNYARGKDFPTGFHPTNMFGIASTDLKRLFNGIQLPPNNNWLHNDMLQILEELDDHRYMEAFTYPGFEVDHLYAPDYIHKHHDGECSDCNSAEYCQKAVNTRCAGLECSRDKLVTRKRIQELRNLGLTVSNGAPWRDWTAAYKEKIHPKIVFGPVASGDRVLKNGRMRDRVAADHDVIAFEMEGAGVWNNFRTVVIKAGCDYGDSHKNKLWQKWAARTAAACAKAFLNAVQLDLESDVESEDGVPSDNPAGVGKKPKPLAERAWNAQNTTGNISVQGSKNVVGNAIDADGNVNITIN